LSAALGARLAAFGTHLFKGKQMRIFGGRTIRLFFIAMLVVAGTPDALAANYVQGTISEITFLRDAILIRVNNGVPTTTCSGASGSWLRIPSEAKPLVALVTGEWLRGNIPGAAVAVYGSGLDGNNFCTVTQIDPIE
jgi:hypothetical protein